MMNVVDSEKPVIRIVGFPGCANLTVSRKTRGGPICVVLLIVAAAAIPGCARPVADNLLFISFDTTRADHLGAYGYGLETSPTIDRLASRGALFERAFAHVPSTLPSHSSMFTGLLPPSHGVRCNGKFIIPTSRKEPVSHPRQRYVEPCESKNTGADKHL